MVCKVRLQGQKGSYQWKARCGSRAHLSVRRDEQWCTASHSAAPASLPVTRKDETTVELKYQSVFDQTRDWQKRPGVQLVQSPVALRP